MDIAEFRAFSVPLDAVAALCCEHGLAEAQRVERIDKGEVSASFEVHLRDGTDLVLKVFCRSPDPAPMIRQETAMRYLREHSDVPVPQWTLLDVSGKLLPHPCLLMERLAGVDADDLWPLLDRGRAQVLLQRCGAALRQYHETPLAEPAGLLSGGVYPAEVWAERMTEAYEHALEGLRRQGWIDLNLLTAAEQAWERGQAAIHSPYQPSLLHRDYQLWNLRVNPENLEIVGVLDLDAVGIGPAATDARDLELNLFLHHRWMREAFWRGYGTIPPVGAEAERLRLSALVRALSLLCAYWGPAANLTPATVWLLLSPWTEDLELM